MKRRLILLMVVLLIKCQISNAQWSLTGNGGTTPYTNFIGTTDATKLVFKVNSQLAGVLDHNSTSAITAFGYLSLPSNTGTINTAIGYQTLASNSSGSNNDAYGVNTLYGNSTSNGNSSFGNNALYTNTTGINNIAFGAYALNGNTSGRYNVAMGGFSLFNNTAGGTNTACGYRALSSNVTGAVNTALGYEALFFNTSVRNVGVGVQSLYTNTAGNNNTSVGYQSLYSMDGIKYNAALGANALFSTTTGYNNTAAGFSALYSNTSGDNTAVGRDALYYNTTGHENSALGEEALLSNQTGFELTGLGTATDVNADGYSNSIALGYLATITASNQVRIGNSSVTSIGGYASWSNISDGRFKKNINENVPGLQFIRLLRPVTYNLNITALNKFLRPSPVKAFEGTHQHSVDNSEAISQKEMITYTGFIAQEVEASAKKLNYSFSGIDAPKNDKDAYSLRYADFVAPLVKAAQELNTLQGNLQTKIESLEAKLNDLRQQIQK